MRILLWCAAFPPGRGGIEVFVDGLIRELGPRGFRFAAVAPAGDQEPPAAEEHAGVPIHRLAFHGALAGRDPAGLLRVRRRVAALERDFEPELVHVHGFHPGHFFRVDSARRNAIPQLLTLHGWPALDFAPDTVQGRLVRGADRIAACSEAVRAQALRDLPELAARCHVVHNGSPLELLPPAPLPFDPPSLLFLGRLAPEKGAAIALAALARLAPRMPRLVLRVVGEGPERARLEKQAAELGLEARVEFRGPVPHRAVATLLNEATVVVVPSRGDEPFGLVALEAALMARPVVATRVGGLPEVVRHGHGGLLVPDGDPEALARAIQETLREPARARTMGEAAKARAVRHFDWTSCADRYASLYDELREGRARA